MGIFSKNKEKVEEDIVKNGDLERRLRRMEMRYLNLIKKVDRIEEELATLIESLEDDEDELEPEPEEE